MGRGLARVWAALARALGSAVRAVGRGAGSARDLDPTHRRDGLGLALLGAALIIAVGVWLDFAGPVGRVVTSVLRALTGAGVVALPPVLLWAAVVTFRRPGDPGGRGRAVIGWVCLGAALLGLCHIGLGSPSDQAGRKTAGGALGALAAGPFESGVGPILGSVLLVLLGFFGLLVVTGTPVHAIGESLRSAVSRLPGRRAQQPAADVDDGAAGAPEGDELEGLRSTRLRRPARRRQATLVEEDRDPDPEDGADHGAPDGSDHGGQGGGPSRSRRAGDGRRRGRPRPRPHRAGGPSSSR